MQRRVDEKVRDAGELHQIFSGFPLKNGKGTKAEGGFNLPRRQRARNAQRDTVRPSGNTHEIGTGRGRGKVDALPPCAEIQESPETACGVDAEFSAGHNQAAVLSVDKARLLAAKFLLEQGPMGKGRMVSRRVLRKKECRVAARIPFRKLNAAHDCSSLIFFRVPYFSHWERTCASSPPRCVGWHNTCDFYGMIISSRKISRVQGFAVAAQARKKHALVKPAFQRMGAYAQKDDWEVFMKSLRFLVLAAALVLSYAVAAAAAPVNCTKKIESFDFVVDYSGSMMMKNTKLKKDKILVAKDIMHRINADIPNQQFNAGLHTISPNGTILAHGPWERSTMDRAIDKLKSNFDVFGRMTYMGDSLSKYQSFLSSMKRDAALILFTDGGNNSGVDFVEVARQIYAQQRNLTIHIVDFSETPDEKASIKALAALNPNAQCVRAEDLAKSDADLERFVIAVFCGQQQKTESVIVLRGVNFAFDSYALDAKAQGILNEAAAIIKENPGKRITLRGWTDSKGSDRYNAKLSQNRANSVKSYLATQGVPASRMAAIGAGKSFKYDNSTEEGRYMNRRTEVSFD